MMTESWDWDQVDCTPHNINDLHTALTRTAIPKVGDNVDWEDTSCKDEFIILVGYPCRVLEGVIVEVGPPIER